MNNKNIYGIGVSVLIGYFIYKSFNPSPPPGMRPSPCSPYGDIDGDGWVSENDMNLLGEYLVGSITLTPDQLHRANVKGTDIVDVASLLLIGQYLEGIIDTFPACDRG